MIRMLTAHLWQSTFFAVAAALLTMAFRKNRAGIRYWMWLSASLKFFIPFALLLNLGRYLETWMPTARQMAPPAISYTIEQFSEPFFPDSLPAPAPAPDTIHWMPIAILATWLCGFAIVALIRFRNWLRVRAAVRASTATNISATVEIRVSPGLLEPGVVGLIRPILLLPGGIAERLTPSELNAVLAHELCHIRRRDNLFAAIHMAVEAIFWFHPLVWWIGARLVEEREGACDEEVLSQGNQPEVYADAILNICKLYVESPLACVSGVSGASIRQRIEAIMSNRKLQGLNRAKKLLLTAAGFAALAGPIAIGLLIGVGNIPAIHAQLPVAAPPAPIQLAQAQTPPPPAATQPPAPRPKFDAVSVRRCMPGDELTGPPAGRNGGSGGRGSRYSPGRLRVQCVDTGGMIMEAYVSSGTDPLLNFQVMPFDSDSRWLRNAPPWVKSDWYTIDAETDDPVANGPTGTGQRDAEKRMEQMLQLVLEDRFQLKIHRDTEDVPMYDLTVAKGGLKIKPMEAGGCTERDPSKGVRTSEMFPPGQKPLCTSWMHMNGPDWALDSAGQPLSNLANWISNTLNRHVFDKTGVTDLFVLHLQFAHDETTPGSFPPDLNDRLFPHTDVPPGPSIFTVLEGLGLKLEPVKGPQGIIVVDHVERPSEN
jgi:uncharacterized protein (TIGR03435 family)